jgi:hypothetical protein
VASFGVVRPAESRSLVPDEEVDVAPPLRRGSALLGQRLTGLLFLGVILGLIGLTIALYQKAFTPVVRVVLEADSIGNQLSVGGDVKVRGLIVGEVRGVSSTGDGATLDLALDPDQVDLIPADVEAQLLPKTLFGEKFVSLVVPEGASDRRSVRATSSRRTGRDRAGDRGGAEQPAAAAQGAQAAAAEHHAQRAVVGAARAG